MRTSLTRAGMIAAAASLALGLAACGSGSDENQTSADQDETVAVIEEAPGDDSPPVVIDAGEGDYTMGLGRESIAEAIAETYAGENATTAWEGDTLVVTMDGDAEAPMAGWGECRVVTQFVEEGDSVALVFPNGRLECSEVLEQ